MKVFSNRQLRTLRSRRHMTQADVATAIGVEPQAISRWELGKEYPPEGAIEKLCSLFSVARETLEEERSEPRDPGLDRILECAKQLNSYNRQRAERFVADLLAIQTGEQKLRAQEFPIHAEARKVTGDVRCNFCGKPQNLCDLLIAADKTYICGECVKLCNEIVDEKQSQLIDEI